MIVPGHVLDVPTKEVTALRTAEAMSLSAYHLINLSIPRNWWSPDPRA